MQSLGMTEESFQAVIFRTEAISEPLSISCGPGFSTIKRTMKTI